MITKIKNTFHTAGINSFSMYIYNITWILNCRANHLERFFGRQARNGMKLMGGIESVAIALSGRYSSILSSHQNPLISIGSLHLKENKTKLWSIDAIVSLSLPVSASTQSTQKYPKEPKRSQKHPIVPKVLQKHTKVPTQKHPTVPKSTQK